MEYQIPVPTSLSVVPVNFHWAAQRDVGGIPKGHKTRTLEIRIIRDGSHAKNDDSWRGIGRRGERTDLADAACLTGQGSDVDSQL